VRARWSNSQPGNICFVLYVSYRAGGKRRNPHHPSTQALLPVFTRGNGFCAIRVCVSTSPSSSSYFVLHAMLVYGRTIAAHRFHPDPPSPTLIWLQCQSTALYSHRVKRPASGPVNYTAASHNLGVYNKCPRPCYYHALLSREKLLPWTLSARSSRTGHAEQGQGAYLSRER